MNNFTAALATVHCLKIEGVIRDYAIGGAMALVFWSEPIPTFDLDVFALSRRNNYQEEGEHVFISGMPVQFIPHTTRWQKKRSPRRLNSTSRVNLFESSVPSI